MDEAENEVFGGPVDNEVDGEIVGVNGDLVNAWEAGQGALVAEQATHAGKA